MGSLWDVKKFILLLQQYEAGLISRGVPFIVYFMYVYLHHRQRLRSQLLEFLFLNIAFVVAQVVEKLDAIINTMKTNDDRLVPLEELRDSIHNYDINGTLFPNDRLPNLEWNDDDDASADDTRWLMFFGPDVKGFFQRCHDKLFHTVFDAHVQEIRGDPKMISRLLALISLFVVDLHSMHTAVRKIEDRIKKNETLLVGPSDDYDVLSFFDNPLLRMLYSILLQL